MILLFALASMLAYAQEDSTAQSYVSPGVAASVDELWDQANTAYINASYDQAIAIYDSIAKIGGVGHKLYYNMANAYFKMGQIGKSVLYYNKAHKLAPTDGDITYNLEVANSYVKDKIEQVPQFFLKRWVHSLRISLGASAWSMISLGVLVLACAGVLVYLLSGRLSLRKRGFFVAVVFLALFITSSYFAIRGRQDILSPSEGVVMHTAVPVKSSPDRASKDLFVIHEGTKVRVVGDLREWCEVILADGNKGWIEASSIEMI